LTITPPIIPLSGSDGPQWGTTDIAAGAGAALNIVGDASGSYRQNMMFHRDAFALCIVPMVSPPGAVDVARQSYKGTSVRVIPYYDGANDVSNYRLDVLYGVKVVDNRLAVRMTGGTSTLGNPSL
jgi:P22 coat protein - gene protein 5